MMQIEEFGTQLIETGDLDPVYIAIVRAQLPKPQLAKLLFAYWHFYHLGSAAWLSEQDDFWRWMEIAAANNLPAPFSKGRWPRAAERRHFRGQKCVDAIQVHSRKNDTPFTLIGNLLTDNKADGVMRKVQYWALCGPWIAFKAADMIDRCWEFSLEFPKDLCLIYKEPRASLELLAVGSSPEEEMERLLAFFSRFKAPPRGDRPCGVQEVETILCKTASYWKGHYYVGKDIHEIRQGLAGWGNTAELMLRGCPEEVDQGNLFK